MAALLISAVFYYLMTMTAENDLAIPPSSSSSPPPVPGVWLRIADAENAYFEVYPYNWTGVVAEGVPYYYHYQTAADGTVAECPAADTQPGFRVEESGLLTRVCLVSKHVAREKCARSSVFYPLSAIPYKEPVMTIVSVFNYLYADVRAIDLTKIWS